MAFTFKPGYYTNYPDSLRGQNTDRLVRELLRTPYNLRDAASREDMCEDVDFFMDWQGSRIAVSLKDESKAPVYAVKTGRAVPDIYIEVGRRHRRTHRWEDSAWQHGVEKVTHYMIAWWLEDGKSLELRLYSRKAIQEYLDTRLESHCPTFRGKGNPTHPGGWHKILELSPEVVKTQDRLYDNAMCGYIPANAVPCDLLAFRYDKEGTLEEVSNA